MSNIKDQKFLNPKTGRMVGYWNAKYMGIIPQELLDQEKGPKTIQLTREDMKVETVRVSDLKFDKRLFVPLSTGNNNLDKFVSAEGGFMPATNVIMTGSPGIGKSTVGMSMLSRMSRQGKRTLFISGEMNRIDMYRYCRRFPEFGDLDTLFIGDYLNSSPKLAIEIAFDRGYDAVLIDSFAEVCLAIQDCEGWNGRKAESWFLDLMEKHNQGENETNTFTCFLIIQQVTKSGDFVGSNRLKHMTSAMLQMFRDRDAGTNIMEFTKNRVGTAGEQLGFRIDHGSVNFAPISVSVAGLEDDEEGEEE